MDKKLEEFKQPTDEIIKKLMELGHSEIGAQQLVTMWIRKQFEGDSK